jgi:hypothetical protein
MNPLPVMTKRRAARASGLCLAVLAVLASGAVRWSVLGRSHVPTAAPTPLHAASSTSSAGTRLPSGVDLADVMRQVHFAFRQEGSAYVGGDSTYSVAARDGVVSLTASSTAQRGEALRLQTTRVSRSRSRPFPAAEQRIDAHGALSITRGDAVETWTNKATGSEQAWRFASRPTGDGDLLVEVGVSGLDYVGATANGLHFADRAGLGFRYAHATWVDADGARVAVAASYERGVIALRVPRAVVDSAAYPAVLDPTVGPEIGIDERLLSTPGSGMDPQIVFDGVNYFVVWADSRQPLTSGDDVYKRSLYGARVAPSGSVLDPNGILIATSAESANFAVASSGANYLVVWQQGSGVQTDIYGARVSTDGALLDATSFPISSSTEYVSAPRVAFDGTNYFVIWTDQRLHVQQAIYGARVTPSGVVLDSDGISLTASVGGSTNFAAIAFDGTNYLVAWEDHYNPKHDDYEIYATRVSKLGSVLDPDGIQLSSGAGYRPAIAFDGSNYLVVWDGSTGPEGTRVTLDGDVLDPTGLLLASIGRFPAVAFDGTDYLLVWSVGGEDTTNEVRGTRVSTAGVPADPNGVLLRSEAVGDYALGPKLAFDGTNYLVVWSDLVDDTSDEDVHGVRVSPAGAPVDGVSLQIATGRKDEDNSSVAFDGTNYLAVWQDSRNGNDDIYAARISADGTLLDPTGIAISTAAGAQRLPKIAFGGANYVVVWQDLRGVDTDIYATRVNKAGTVLDPAGIALSTVAYDQRAPCVAFGATDYLVVWSDGRSGTNDDIYATRVSKGGAVLDPAGIAVASAPSDESSPALASDGENYLVAWSQADDDSDQDIYAARVSAAGIVDDVPGIAIATAAGDQVTPAVAFDGTSYLIAWADFRNGSTSDIYAARITTTGALVDSNGLVVANAVNAQTHPALAFDGTDYLVTWQDDRSGTSSDVYAARVSSQGAVRDADGFIVSATQDVDDATPALAFSTNGRALVFYRRADDPGLGRGWRLKARAVCPNGRCNPAPEDDAGTDDDAGIDLGAGTDGAGGASGTGAAGTPAVNDGSGGGGTIRDAGTTPPTHDAGATHDPSKARDAGTVFVEFESMRPPKGGCQCNVARATRPPFASLVLALFASGRLIRRRRRHP